MRWDNLRLVEETPSGTAADSRTPALVDRSVMRTFDTPGFRGMTFYEVHARSIINRVPEASHVPFRWTINPYRGCSHSCRYCFARKTHNYLDLDAGEDFNSQVVVKVNAAERARRELAAPRWRGEHVAMGTNVDCYQRAEGRYELMRGVLAALRDFRNPFSILTKGSLILRDLDLLGEAANVTDVGTSVSVGFLDRDMWRTIEPGTPHPQKRLDMCRNLREAGLPCSVLMAPIVPYLTDSPAQLDATVHAIAEAGADSVTPIVLHLRPGAREWFMAWLREHHPDLVGRYEQLYRGGAYARKGYTGEVTSRVQDLARHYGVGADSGGTRRISAQRRRPPPGPEAEQLSLL